MAPQPRDPSAAGISRRSGVIARGAVAENASRAGLESISATRVCHPRGRSAGMANHALPVRTPSTSCGSVHSLVWDSSRLPPSSSSTCTRTAAPSGRWTGTEGEAPDRTTITRGSVSLQGASSTSVKEALISSSVLALTPRAARTATSVAREGAARLP